MERKILVSSAEQALGLMKAFLVSNMLDNELAVFDKDAQEPQYQIKFGWFSRDLEDDDMVGSPCFVCDYEGMLPGSKEPISGVVYVKVFASKDANLTKMHILTPQKRVFFDEIEDGECFKMEDPIGRYEKEDFIYKDGVVSKK